MKKIILQKLINWLATKLARLSHCYKIMVAAGFKLIINTYLRTNQNLKVWDKRFSYFYFDTQSYKNGLLIMVLDSKKWEMISSRAGINYFSWNLKDVSIRFYWSRSSWWFLGWLWHNFMVYWRKLFYLLEGQITGVFQ